MEYAAVPHSHVASAGYLRAWADGAQIAMRLAGGSTTKVIGVKAAGVRSNFYRRTRPGSGETIYDVEWSLSQAETVCLPALRRLTRSWPPTLEEKGKVGQLLALQLVRGPAFAQWHERCIERKATPWRAAPERYARPGAAADAVTAVEEAIAAMKGDTHRLTKMLKITRLTGIAFTSMHWTLVHFEVPRLATSDQPVVVWPLSRGRSLPCANDLDAGVTQTLEAFVALGPSDLLLMTWRTGPDTRQVVTGANRELATANSFAIANADQQWFHQPGLEPWVAKGPRKPLSSALLTRYDRLEALQSPLRLLTARLATAEAAAPLSNGPVSVVDGSLLAT